MIELTVKTLDSKNHAFSVPDDVTVKQLKERIADSVNISAESQRLIYCGRVLQDEKNLSEYDVNGKVIHLVQRAPPGNNGNCPDRGPSSTRSASGSSGPRRTQQWRTLFGQGGNSGNAMYLGAMAFPAEIMEASGIAMQQPRQCLSQSRLAIVRNMLARASTILDRLENPHLETTDSSPENGNGQVVQNNEEENASASTPVSFGEISSGPFIVDNQPVDSGGTNVDNQPEVTSEQNTTSSENEPSSTTNAQQHPQNDNEDEGSSASSRYPRTRALADLLDQAAEINTRVQPFMAQYQQLMRSDPAFSDQVAVTTNQRLFTNVSEIMHNLAHAYHALSDIMCDFSQQPPRFLRCRPVLIHHSAVVQTGIPIQVSTNVTENNTTQQNTTNANSRATENGSQQATTNDPNISSTTEQAQTNTTQESENHQPANVDESIPAQVSVSTNTSPAVNSENSTSREPRSPSTSPPRISRIGSIGTASPGFEVFVDVGPGSITIDSVEATVVTNAPVNTSEPNTWQNPPEFVQNLITALAGQFIGASFQQGGVGSNGATNTPTTASSQQNNSQSAAGIQNSQARGNTATHPTTATQTRSTARPHVHLSPSLHGLRSNNFDPFLPCNSHHIRSSRGGRQRTSQTQVNGGTNDTTESPRIVPIPTPSSISISLRADPINMEQLTSRNVAQQNASPSLPPELQAFMNPNASLNTSQTSSFTLAQLLQNIPGYSYNPGESIITDIFMTLAQSLSFLDMVHLGLGRSECLIRARPQLRHLVSQRLLNNQPLTISAITQIIDRFNAELRPYYTIFDNARLREEVDLPASINLYNHSMLPSVLNTVMEEDQSTFHRTLMRKSALYVRQLCALLQYCCLDGVTGLESILRAFVNQMTTGVPDVLQEWTMSHSIVNLRTFVSTLSIPVEDIKRFLVYRINKPASPKPATTPSGNAIAVELMDIQEISEAGSTTSLICDLPIADVPPNQQINEVIGWQNTLPSDWVPIITRDSQRQRRQNSQGPFSDAYLSGMPSKRRKLITSVKPQGNLSQVITESMATALGAAGMSSGPEVDVIAQRAGQDGILRAAYREQVRSTLRNNLITNPDYAPDKYPNTAKYFKKQ